MQKILLLLACIASLYSCDEHESVKGNGNMKTEQRTVGSFKGIELMGSMNVEVKKGGESSVEIEGEENIISYVETYINDGLLVIKYRDNIDIDTRKEVTVHVTTPALEQVKILGSGDITGEGLFSSAEAMHLNITGSGNIKLEVDAPTVEASITGSGDMYLDGRTKDVELTTMGSGKIDAFSLKAENARVKTMGSGDIRVFGSVKIDASINGSGDIAYKGGGTISSQTHGSGSVQAIE